MKNSDAPAGMSASAAKHGGGGEPDNVAQLIDAIQPFLSGAERQGALPQGASIIINFHNQGGIYNTGTAQGIVLGSSDVDLTLGQRSDRKDAPAAAQEADLDTWFDTDLEPRERCLTIAVAFLPGASFTAILDACDRLATALLPDAQRAGAGGFGKSRSAQLRRIQAIVEDGDAGEQVRFAEAERYDLIRRYIWEERTDIRGRLVQWMAELAREGDTRTALALGVGVGACASFAFASMFDSILMPWVRKPMEQSLLATGEALGVAVQTSPRSKEQIVRRLQEWAGAGATDEERIRAIRLCASSWGAIELDEALALLHRAESLAPHRLFEPVQRAIDFYWAWASLVPDTAARIAEQLAKGLERWDNGDRQSVVCILPMVHLAHAIHAETGYLKDEQASTAPLLLRRSFRDSGGLEAVAPWLERGVRNRHTRGFVRSVLESLLERARELGLREDFAMVATAMLNAATDEDGRARIRYFAESWKITLGQQDRGT
ncbi:hypothetical protein [Sphingomonas sp. NIBR02145]|uniref:hypothetical protein n=1 Tax=Sphingomonas sp. NIBR02145 TaxID=3014784 RepID=UPI0022B5315C|nr:hypothetical protein [Sphingomonas sp. NIBR02145]WHU03101.1 hypothetical protein O3305_00350 [Sphingomonas sp. NIBR02145]